MEENMNGAENPSEAMADGMSANGIPQSDGMPADRMPQNAGMPEEKPEEKKKSGKAGSFALGLLAGAVIAAIVFAIVYNVVIKPDTGRPDVSSFLSDEAIAKILKIQEKIQKYYLFDQDVDTDTSIIKAYVDSYGDPYTVYYTPDEYAELMQSNSGTYCGIGVVVTQNASTGVITVVRPYEDGPGAEAGIEADDIIYKVEGEEVTGQDLSLVVTKIKGDAGTDVTMTIYRPSTGEYIDVICTRREIEIEVVSHEMLDDNIGYIEMSSFTEVTYDQFMEAYNDLKDQGMESLIVDIRDNGGGLLTSVCDILDELLPEGIITYTEDRDGEGETIYSDADTVLDVPLVVLVNGNSASASEIFTGAIQDYGVGTIVGTQTFGKGIVQTIMSLDDGSALKVTTSRYYTPNGVCIHGVGITPDVVVESDKDAEGDEQLNAAIDVLMEEMGK